MHSKIRFTNRSMNEVLLVLEPWAEEYRMQPNASVEIVATTGAELDGYFEIEWNHRGMVVHGWGGCVLTVMSNGVELEPSPQG